MPKRAQQMVAITGSVAQLSEPTSTSGSVETYSTRKRLQVAHVEEDATSGAAGDELRRPRQASERLRRPLRGVRERPCAFRWSERADGALSADRADSMFHQREHEVCRE